MIATASKLPSIEFGTPGLTLTVTEEIGATP